MLLFKKRTYKRLIVVLYFIIISEEIQKGEYPQLLSTPFGMREQEMVVGNPPRI